MRTNLLLLHMRDHYTYNHSERVARYLQVISQNIGSSSDDMRTLRIGAVLHDIGKVRIHGDPDQGGPTEFL